MDFEEESLTQKTVSLIKKSLSDKEHFFFDDQCDAGSGYDDALRAFNEVANISDGILIYVDTKVSPPNHGGRGCTFEVFYKIYNGEQQTDVVCSHTTHRHVNTPKLCNDLNELLRVHGYGNDKYFFDISQDIGLSGIAFSNFETELALFESRVLWRGINEFERSNGFEYFWAKKKEHQ